MRQFLLRRWAAVRGSATTGAFCALAGALSTAPLAAFAQSNAPVPGVFADEFIAPSRVAPVLNCFQNADGTLMPVPAEAPAGSISSFGDAMTPRGDTRWLVIYAGFDADNVSSASGISQDNADPGNPWPQTDAVNTAWGSALPRTAYNNTLFYSNYAQFSPTDQRNNISNQLYQMSRFAPNGAAPFRVIAEALPQRINVARAPTAGQHNFGYYNQQLWNRVKAVYPSYDWARFDGRTNAPNFSSDNSISPPDGKLDYVLIIWRVVPNGNLTSLGYPALVNDGAQMGIPTTTGLVGTNGQTYDADGWSGGYIQYGPGDGLSRRGFGHEFAHSLYRSTHYNGANGVVGPHFQSSFGWGMMDGSVNSCINGWERWYLGWSALTTGPTAVNANLDGPQNLTTDGLYTLRDYVQTGDLMRIRIPNTNQYLWLSNHTSNHALNQRYDFTTDGQGNVMAGAPLGLLAMVEDMRTPTQNTIIGYYDLDRGGAFRPISSRGNFDYTPNGPLSTWNNYIYGNRFYDLIRGEANALGAQGDIQRFRWDTDGNGTIAYSGYHGNGTTRNESTLNGMMNGVLMPAYLGTDIAFTQVGQKLGMMTNPALTPHVVYDAVQNRNAPILLHGLSVRITAKDAATGTLTVQVRFNDTDMGQSQRWCGDLVLDDIPNAPYDVNVAAAATLTLDLSSTAARTTINPLTNAFTNLTTLVCRTASVLRLAPSPTTVVPGGALMVKNKSTLTLQSGSLLDIQNGAKLTVESGGTVIVENGALLQAVAGGLVQVDAGGKIIVRNTDPAKGLRIANGARLLVTGTGQVVVETGARLDLLATPTAATSGLTLQDQASGLVVRGTLATAANVDFTFFGKGNITFDGTAATLTLGSGSRWLQTGFLRTTRVYELTNGAIISVTTPEFNLNTGQIKYGAGTSLTVISTGTATLNNVDLAGLATAPATTLLTCQAAGIVSVQNTQIRGAANGLNLTGSYPSAVLRGVQIADVTNTGIRLGSTGNAQVAASYINNCRIGVESAATTLRLNENTRFAGNREAVVVPGTAPTTLVIGDVGCAWIANSTVAGVRGTNVTLSIDAITNQGANPTPQINRFDGNPLIFDLCYTSGRPASISARGNYWGAALPVAGTNYRIVTCGTTTPQTTLVTTNAVTCAPVSCASCVNNPGGRPAPGTSKPGIDEVAAAAAPLQLVPNPAPRGAVRLVMTEPASYQYRVVNNRGETVQTGQFTGTATELTTTKWPAGAYRVVLWRPDTGTRTAQTLVVE